MFEFDIRPNQDGPSSRDLGSAAKSS
jgi:hypothetical protein